MGERRELIPLPEAAEMIGVKRQRLHYLIETDIIEGFSVPFSEETNVDHAQVEG